MTLNQLSWSPLLLPFSLFYAHSSLLSTKRAPTTKGTGSLKALGQNVMELSFLILLHSRPKLMAISGLFLSKIYWDLNNFPTNIVFLLHLICLVSFYYLFRNLFLLSDHSHNPIPSCFAISPPDYCVQARK